MATGWHWQSQQTIALAISLKHFHNYKNKFLVDKLNIQTDDENKTRDSLQSTVSTKMNPML